MRGIAGPRPRGRRSVRSDGGREELGHAGAVTQLADPGAAAPRAFHADAAMEQPALPSARAGARAQRARTASVAERTSLCLGRHYRFPHLVLDSAPAPESGTPSRNSAQEHGRRYTYVERNARRGGMSRKQSARWRDRKTFGRM